VNERKTRGGAVAICVFAAVLVFSVAMFLSVKTGIDGFVKYKANATGGITATGSASVDFKSDRATWSGYFSATAATTQDAYEIIEQDAELIFNYLRDSGLDASDVAFGSTDIYTRSRTLYGPNGEYLGEEFEGYELSRSVYVASDNVDLVEKISSDITSLIVSGVNIRPDSPSYYYTKLDELKLDLIEQATQNARERVNIVASNSGAEVGKLQNATLGVFQITATNSATDDFTAYGTLNTWSKFKTASITVKLYFAVD
jgi:hypothetical protein